MNFFESQDRVRKNTQLLLFLFTLAVVTLIVMTNLLVMMVFGATDSDQIQDGATLFQRMDWQRFAIIGTAVAAVVLAGSLYKIAALSGGGRTIAEALDGKLVPRNTDDPKQRKLLNVVEEMAIASGTPAPPVYVLADEPGINAFAAGFSPRDAVIGVTQGTIDHLSRDQLQGVIAHEFSHIMNGDMRLNIRLMGALHGILILGIIGYGVLRFAPYFMRVRTSEKGGGAVMGLAIGMFVLGGGLMAIGFAGTFFSGLIKAAVSRQREFLADASAVQFTRNPGGIAGALKRIGGLGSGSKVENASAPEMSHAFFAQGMSGFMQALSATHPPLGTRIRRIDPSWNGRFDYSDEIGSDQDQKEADETKPMAREDLARTVAAVVASTAMANVENAIGQIGNPTQEAIGYARSLILELPLVVKETAREPYGARAVVYALVLDPEPATRDRQLEYLRDHVDSGVFVLTRDLIPEIDGLATKYRLPLIDIVVPALKQLSDAQYKAFRENLTELIQLDPRVDLLEWSLRKIIFNHLDGQFFKPTHTKVWHYGLGQLKKDIEMVLSVLARAGHRDQGDMEAAFRAGTKVLKFDGLRLLDKSEIRLSDLDLSLQKLAHLKPRAMPQLMTACAASVVHDQKIAAIEIELLRAFSGALDCPMPPIVPASHAARVQAP